MEAEQAAYISPRKLAKKFDLHINTIYLEIKRGHLKAMRLPGNHIRISQADVASWLEEYNKEIH